jgi:predicted transcriptional regulator
MMRYGLKLSKREKKQAEKRIKQLYKMYANGKIAELNYRHERSQIIANLKRPVEGESNIERNEKGFFQDRRDMQFGPAPVGYWNRDHREGPPQKQVSDNKVRAALIDISTNGWWNDGGLQESLQQNAIQQEKARNSNNESWFKETIMTSNDLGATQNEIKVINQIANQLNKASAMHKGQADRLRNLGAISAKTFSNSGIWNEIQSSPEVIKALNRLQQAIEYQKSRMYAIGITGEEARNAIRLAAVKSGSAMTNEGYSPARAAEIVSEVVRGSLTVKAASSVVASDINSAAANINATSQPMWRNNFNPYLELPRQTTLQNGAPIQPNASYNLNENPTMKQTASAVRGGPNIMTVVKDIFTIEGNTYFNWQSGDMIAINDDGMVANTGYSYPRGSWTVFASGYNSVPAVENIKQSLTYALASPLWSPEDRAYLAYLLNLTIVQLGELKQLPEPVVTSQIIANVENMQMNHKDIMIQAEQIEPHFMQSEEQLRENFVSNRDIMMKSSNTDGKLGLQNYFERTKIQKEPREDYIGRFRKGMENGQLPKWVVEKRRDGLAKAAPRTPLINQATKAYNNMLRGLGGSTSTTSSSSSSHAGFRDIGLRGSTSTTSSSSSSHGGMRADPRMNYRV